MRYFCQLIAVGILIIGTSATVSAQAVNCGAALSDAGTLTPPASTNLTIGLATAPAVLSGYAAGLPNIEYAIINPNEIVYDEDSLAPGPRFLDANSTGVFDPTAYGLGVGDDFCVVATSYDLGIVKDAVDEILNGSFLFTSCCALIPTFAPDAGDICGALNSAGIFGPGDVNSINDVFSLVTALGGAESFEALAQTIDVEINPLIASGTPCVGNDLVCYTISPSLCYTIVSGSAPCVSAPDGLSSTVGASQVSLNWNPVSASVACQVKGTRIVPPGPSPSVNIFGSEPTSTNVPVSAAGAGTTWEWRVRCACSISPLVVTPFSATNTFSVPVPREGMNLDASVFPNPADHMITLNYQSAEAVVSLFEIIDITGRVVKSASRAVVKGANQMQFDVSNLEPGVYLLQTAAIGEALIFTVE